MNQSHPNAVRTRDLDIAYHEGGPASGKVVFLLHGWPDSPQAWFGVLPFLWEAGFRTITPYLRGFGQTQFTSSHAPRSGQPVALAADLIALADALRVQQFVIAGHDWGAQTAYATAALYPDRLTSLAALAVPFEPGGKPKTPPVFEQPNKWYQWFMNTKNGPEAVAADPIAFARMQWDMWSPKGWYTQEEFDLAATAFTNPDWLAITLHSYRVRWGSAKPYLKYTSLQRRMDAARTLSVPTLQIHGQVDTCTDIRMTEGQEAYFTGPFRKSVLAEVGHFLPREAPEAVATELVAHFATVRDQPGASAVRR